MVILKILYIQTTLNRQARLCLHVFMCTHTRTHIIKEKIMEFEREGGYGWGLRKG